MTMTERVERRSMSMTFRRSALRRHRERMLKEPSRSLCKESLDLEKGKKDCLLSQSQALSEYASLECPRKRAVGSLKTLDSIFLSCIFRNKFWRWICNGRDVVDLLTRNT
jgi:hypothetical protein